MANKIDIQKEILLHIVSERTANHTINWKRLKVIGDSLHELILAMAEAHIGKSIDKLNERLSLEAMPALPGSYAPAFKIHGEGESLFDDGVLDIINNKFNKLAELASRGQYVKVLELYPEKKNGAEVGSAFYTFQKSFDGMPVSFAQVKSGKIKDLYPIKEFKNRDKQQIIKYLPEVKKRQKPLIISEGLAKVRVSKTPSGKITRKITELYENTEVASIKFEHIIHKGRKYLLNFPILVEEGKEEDYPFLKLDILDLYASGPNIEDAKLDFYEDFDYLYRRLNDLPNDKLGDKMLKAKRYLELTVKKVENVSNKGK